ncbi:hypothetical protein BW450_23295 [Salmonella enterica]|nr:hypothetical protein [Salmonella enterica]
MIELLEKIPFINITVMNKKNGQFLIYKKKGLYFECSQSNVIYMNINHGSDFKIKKLIDIQNTFAPIIHYANAGVHYQGGIYLCKSYDKDIHLQDFVRDLILQYSITQALETEVNYDVNETVFFNQKKCEIRKLV